MEENRGEVNIDFLESMLASKNEEEREIIERLKETWLAQRKIKQELKKRKRKEGKENSDINNEEDVQEKRRDGTIKTAEEVDMDYLHYLRATHASKRRKERRLVKELRQIEAEKEKIEQEIKEIEKEGK